MSRINGSPLYQRQIASLDDDTLMRQVWDPTPWMTSAYTDSISSDRYEEIMNWCRKKFGAESSPIFCQPGQWRSGSSTVFGTTWMGFATEEMMDQFIQRWPTPEQA